MEPPLLQKGCKDSVPSLRGGSQEKSFEPTHPQPLVGNLGVGPAKIQDVRRNCPSFEGRKIEAVTTDIEGKPGEKSTNPS